MHKSADVAQAQIARGGAVGICCQKVSEAEALMRAGLADVLVSNQVVGEARVARLVRLTERGAVAVCADHPDQVAAFSRAVTARRAETGSDRLTLDVLVEMDCGSGRCGTGSIAGSVAWPARSRPARACVSPGCNPITGAPSTSSIPPSGAPRWRPPSR